MTPARTCVGCRTVFPQPVLRRFTRRDGGWVADGERRRSGRGVYLCSRACAQRVAKNKRYPGFSVEALLQWDQPGGGAGTLRITELIQNDLTADGALGRHNFEGLHGNR